MAGPVLIFDSGMGGLSVARALRAHYPHAALCYACDNAWLPYGLREDSTLTARIVGVCRAAVNACQPSVLVVACNTASTLALEQLRAELTIPVVGTVPAIKPAAAASQSRHIGLLATTATVRRPYTQQLIDNFASDCRITRVAADALVIEAEALISGTEPNTQRLAAALAPLWQAAHADVPMDTVVLGCTHFPLLKPWLDAAAPAPLIWVDSGDAIARRVGQVVSTLVSNRHEGRCFATAPVTSLKAGLAAYGFFAPESLFLDDLSLDH
ncbi:glutamate racemase [Halomonas vilamensis]|uniref:Glutamate racemase n=1 Tax=Vreelandella vilamensis TaxID=531309 RepID=A0ABU1H0U9_9GAMM|nr:glutamate racemase [Halomonas vilamensis]MDR5897888.1 glutamate racemase [Halomonas vilamensis]